MKKICLAIIACALGAHANAQLPGSIRDLAGTVIDLPVYHLCLKPGPADGQDATIMTTYGCILNQIATSGGLVTPTDASEYLNGGANTELDYSDWSYNKIGCGRGTVRSLIKFTGMKALMHGGIYVRKATLVLRGVPISLNYGNSSFDGSPYGTSNEGIVQRITSPWEENLVTWITQPTTTSDNAAGIPASTRKFQWNDSVDITRLVRDIITSGCNQGFMISLQNEEAYRGVIFASSDHPLETLWPELCIDYELAPVVVGGDPLALVCPELITQPGSGKRTEHPAGSFHMEQDRSLPSAGSAMQVVPNPSAGNWNIRLTATAKEQVEVALFSIDGRLISRRMQQLDKGANSFVESGRDLTPGIYILTVKGGSVSERRQLIRQ